MYYPTLHVIHITLLYNSIVLRTKSRYKLMKLMYVFRRDYILYTAWFCTCFYVFTLDVHYFWKGGQQHSPCTTVLAGDRLVPSGGGGTRSIHLSLNDCVALKTNTAYNVNNLNVTHRGVALLISYSLLVFVEVYCVPAQVTSWVTHFNKFRTFPSNYIPCRNVANKHKLTTLGKPLHAYTMLFVIV